ncbi:MAG TPA: N-acyl homoserine lactonase family protein [Steroidobacteraceae bacterium]|nr:N-acyl homoserine lactonase family protein [Steroidobacteraceae bacterium]
MKRFELTLGVAVLAAASLAATSASAQGATAAAELSLTRLDCGKTTTLNDVSRFSDVMAFKGLNIQLTFSCYLVKHGNDYLVWDTGNPAATGASPAPTAPKTSLVEQLAQLHLNPSQITFVGISHYHGDHVGQVASFPEATLLIGKGDWEVLNDPKPNPNVNVANFSHWISGGGKVEPLPGDKDVFGDGSVMMLTTPGHTPGHHSLLVKLKDKGNVLITGDLAHFRENYDSNGVPTFNTSRAETLASLDRFKQLAKNLNATVIIQHDARDIDKLPVFPASAK